MTTTKCHLLKLEAQVNALAQAWMHLAATVEVRGRIDLAAMEDALRHQHWPRAPDIDEDARDTLQWLCGQLDEARAAREARLTARHREKPNAEATCAKVIPFNLVRARHRRNAS
ncbi:hypothetical protein [Azoarcus sp. DN11]|uniref:hypothetical protein n=1 Tax=Azoarcus sp. DN11 TaxID=356837 RepID=UPI00157FA620|nr:hypothetical protein [Azoarcus sp. DN11]